MIHCIFTSSSYSIKKQRIALDICGEEGIDVEIISHGGLPARLTEEEFFDGVSKPRNTHLMDIFKRLGIVEHTGHGIPTILSKYGKEVFRITENTIVVTIPFNKEVIENYGAISGAISGVINENIKLSVE